MVENGGRKGGRQGTNGLCVVPRRMLGRLLDVKVWRGEERELSDCFLVGARLKFVGGWRSEKCVEGE